mgnify:CR=1 FL=1
MEIDLDTNLPSLPEDMFWRVENTEREDGDGLRVLLMRRLRGKRTSWWRVKSSYCNEWVLRRAVRYGNGSIMPPRYISDKDIVRTADSILSVYEAMKNNSSNVERYVGDYPPKKL